MGEIMLLIFVFVIAGFLGVELISKAVAVLAPSSTLGMVFGIIAIVLAAINVVGGYLVTDRMLGMFKKKGDKNK